MSAPPIMSILMLLATTRVMSTGIVCHDCTGVTECAYLLQYDWTGRCHAQLTGRCFIRNDPNGIMYRGCADSLNWPHQLDMTYSGCRYQVYGEWSNTEVLWCFCDYDLCNVNISSILSKIESNQERPVNGEGDRSSQLPPWPSTDSDPNIRPAAVPVPPIIIARTPVGSGNADNWESVQRYLQQAWQLNGGQVAVPGPPSVYVTQQANQPVTPVLPPYYSNAAVQSGGTTAPNINQPTTVTVSNGGAATRSPQQLLQILNSILVSLGLTAISSTPGQQGQLVFDLPGDVLGYLRANLPYGTNNVQSLQYPLYVILYLLSLTGYNISSIIPGINIPVSGLLPGNGSLDVPPPTPPSTGTSLADVCPPDFKQQPSLGSCYRIFSGDARLVSQARQHCQQLSAYANLVSIETLAEKNYLAILLKAENVMLDGWQGWWTSGSFQPASQQFVWATGRPITNTTQFWGFQRQPFQETCVWVLQIPNYNYTLGNYDCFTASGHICEISLASISGLQQS